MKLHVKHVHVFIVIFFLS